jgi:uncharacterized protein
MLKVKDIPAFLTVIMIKVYQKTISFDHGVLKSLYPNGYCKFYPSCSEYAVDALRKKGLIKGSFLVTKRLVRCNPWSEGGIDKVED